MSLDALAPDQRAVVQLVLQQDRSYEELAGLLGISADAVRDRALKGLERLAPAGELSAEELGDVSDYLLGQQSVSGREATRALLATSEPARTWARAVAGELEDVARTPLPGVPGDEAPAEAVAADGLEPELEPDAPADEAPEVSQPEPDAAATAERPVRARPRPRPRDDRDRDRTTAGAGAATARESRGDRPRSNRLGGALLIGGIALLIVIGVIVLVGGGDDDKGGTTKASGTSSANATPTPSATSEFQPLGQLTLKSPTGGKAKGQMVIFANQNGGIAFTIQGTGVPASAEGQAYAIWLTGGGKAHRLGFAPQVKTDGKLGTSGPRDQDATDFAKWFASARTVVVSKETSEDTTKPGPVVLEGSIPRGSSSSSSGG